MGAIVQAEGLIKKYGDKTVLNGVDLAVHEGCVTGLVGANGAGKTTTIRALLGLMPLDAGSVVLFGEPFDTTAGGGTSARVKGRIGVVFDTCPFIGDAAVKTAGAIARAAYPAWDDGLFDSYLRMFDLDPRQKIRRLSRGMGMKLQLACALAHKPDVLVLDEATAGLDPLARDEVLDILRAFVADERHAVLLSSHITSDLEKIADRVVCIDRGSIAFDLEKDAITDQAGIARCRAAEFEQVAASGYFAPGALRFVRNAYGVDVLVEDRFAFARQFRDVACDRASIDGYMQLVLKGEVR